MPTEWLVGMLREGLAGAGLDAGEITADDLWGLPGHLSTPVVDEMVAGHDFPMVIVGDRVVCVGGVDVDSVVEALR